MEVIKTELEGVLLLKPRVFGDNRGFFMETYNKKTMDRLGLHHVFVQDNHSLSEEPGTLRGLHYQLKPMAQTKIVRCVRGAIFDVAVDIRKGSPTFGKWTGQTLTAENKLQLLVPKGFAHGFMTLEPHTEVVYKVDELYSPEHDRAIAWNDPTLAIPWPIVKPSLSDKDRAAPLLAAAELDPE